MTRLLGCGRSVRTWLAYMMPCRRSVLCYLTLGRPTHRRPGAASWWSSLKNGTPLSTRCPMSILPWMLPLPKGCLCVRGFLLASLVRARLARARPLVSTRAPSTGLPLEIPRCIDGSGVCPSCCANFLTRIRVPSHLGDVRRPSCRDIVLSGRFAEIEPDAPSLLQGTGSSSEMPEDTETPTSWLLGRLALLKANASAMSCARLLSLAPPPAPLAATSTFTFRDTPSSCAHKQLQLYRLNMWAVVQIACG